MASPPEMAQMATVELSFTPLPAHVRTARLVATAVARRSGVAESLLDEVRLAVGEACSRAVEAHRLYCPGEPVRIQLSDTGGRFEVVVADAVPGAAVDAAAMRAAVGDSAANPAARTTAAAVARIAAAQPQQQPAGQPAAGQQPAGQPAAASSGTSGATPAVAGTGTDRAAASGAVQVGPAADSVNSSDSAAGTASGGASAANGGLPADIGLAVIAGLADDVHISVTGGGISIRMSWPTA
jgi:anti-sigma regulatory factor (Ser/Thr protein kinase)